MPGAFRTGDPAAEGICFPSGEWGGEFSGREIDGVLKTVHLAEGKGVLMEVLTEMLRENGLELPVDGLFARERERAFSLIRK